MVDKIFRAASLAANNARIPLAQQAVTSAIVGIRTLQHLDGMNRAAELELDTETLAQLDEIFPINQGRPLRTGQPAPEAYAW